jgi:hypothetical protein
MGLTGFHHTLIPSGYVAIRISMFGGQFFFGKSNTRVAVTIYCLTTPINLYAELEIPDMRIQPWRKAEHN